MTNTIEEIEAHAVFSTAEQLRERIGQLQERADDLPEGMLERITALADLLSSRIESSDSIMIPPVSLDQTQKHLHSVITELNNYLSNNNSQHVQNAINNMSSAFQTFPSVFRIEGQGTYNSVLSALSKRAQNQIGKLNSTSKQALADWSQLESELSQMKQAIEVEKQRITEGLGSVENQFTDSQGSRSKAFNEALDGYSASLRERLTESDVKLDEHVQTSKNKFASDAKTILDNSMK